MLIFCNLTYLTHTVINYPNISNKNKQTIINYARDMFNTVKQTTSKINSVKSTYILIFSLDNADPRFITQSLELNTDYKNRFTQDYFDILRNKHKLKISDTIFCLIEEL